MNRLAYNYIQENWVLIENSIKNLTNACEISMPEINMSTFSDEINIENVLTACETLPFMDKLRLNIVKDIDLNENILSKIQKYAENPNIDVSLIAEKFGGSGHRLASGFQTSLETLKEILSCSCSLKEYMKSIGFEGNKSKRI